MPEAVTLFSMPGEWIDRRGRPRPRFPIRRILVIKPDHIGDMLVSDRAIALLRNFFPEARLELVCGTWNVGLAERLGRFDAVHGVDLFHQVSAEQSKEGVADERRARGAEALDALGLGPFDLAIDLRYELDTRRFLQNVDARVYAGFGRTGEFPFLDIVIPRHDAVDPKGSSEIMLVGRDFGPTGAGAALPETPGRPIGQISAREILLGFQIAGAASPKACGVSADERLLGVGIQSVTVQGVAAPDAKAEAGVPQPVIPIFRHGWHPSESWGTWSKENRAFLSFLLPAELTTPFARVDLRMQGQVNPRNAEVRCSIRAGSDGGEIEARFTYPLVKSTTASVVVPAQVRRISLESKPFELLPGSYEGQFRVYLPRAVARTARIDLTLRGLAGKAALARHAIDLGAGSRGIINLGFSCLLETAGERLRIELDCNDADLLDGAQVESLALKAIEQFKPKLPAAHIGDWSSLLVLRIAQIFSDQEPFGEAAPDLSAQSRLREQERHANLSQAVSEASERLQRWRDLGCAVVGVSLGCNTAIRKWPFLYYVELVRELMQLGRVKPVFMGGPDDQAEALDACAALGLDPAEHSLCGVAKLEELGLLLAKLDLFIGNDTGVTHFAGRTGIRTICIKAGTSHPREWGPIGENASWIYRDEPCAPCALHDIAKCKNWLACMRDILPADVRALAVPEVQSVLSRRSKPDGDTPARSRRAGGIHDRLPKYVIHVGPPKTASKYLQSHLFHMRSMLAEAGICYPDYWWTRPDQIFHLPLLDELRKPNPQVAEPLAKLNTSVYRIVVLSCEGFDDLGLDQLNVLREAIGERPVEVVYYCRRWSDRIPSTWRSNVEMGHFLNLPEFYARFRNPANSPEVNYSRAWDKWGQVFGRESLRLVSYSNLVEHKVDPAEHFFRMFLGWEGEMQVPGGRVQSNVSPDLFDTEILRVLNYLDHQATGRRRLNMRLKFRRRREQVDTKALTDLMAEHISDLEIQDGGELFRQSYEAMSTYADCLVSQELGQEIFKKTVARIRYIRPNYLMHDGAAERLKAIYRQVEEMPFQHPEMS